MQLSEDSFCTLVIDECQALDGNVPSFWSELQPIWDTHKGRAKLLLIMIGSNPSAIKHIFGNIREPLYGRADQFLTVRPFGTALVARILNDHAPRASWQDLLAFYALTGGVARYIELLVRSGARTQDAFIDWVFSDAGYGFRDEGQLLLAYALNTASPVYHQILRGIAQGATRWSELNSCIDGQINPYLTRLEKQYGFIRRNYPLYRETAIRGVRFSIANPYFRFWFRFIEPADCRNLIEQKQWGLLRKHCREALPAFCGWTLLQWFIERYKESGHWIDVGGWWDKKGTNEIDLVAVNSLTQEIEMAEIKRNPKKLDMALLQQKAEAFLEANSKYQNFTLRLRGLSGENMTDTLS